MNHSNIYSFCRYFLCILLVFSFCTLDAIGTSKTLNKKDLGVSKTKIIVQTKAGQMFKAFLIDADNEKIYYVKDPKEAIACVASNNEGAETLEYSQIETIKFKRNKILRYFVVLGILAGAILVWFVEAISEYSLDANDIVTAFFIGFFPIFMLGVLINATDYKTKEIKANARITQAYVKHYSLKRQLLENNLKVSNQIAPIELLKKGYLDHNIKHRIKFNTGQKSLSAYLVKVDNEFLHVVKKKSNIVLALLGRSNEVQKIKLSEISGIK